MPHHNNSNNNNNNQYNYYSPSERRGIIGVLLLVVAAAVVVVLSFVLMTSFNGCSSITNFIGAGKENYKKHTKKAQEKQRASFKITKFEVPFFNQYNYGDTDVPIYVEWNKYTPTYVRLVIEYNMRRGPLGSSDNNDDIFGSQRGIPEYELWDRSKMFGSYYTVFDSEALPITNPTSRIINEVLSVTYSGRYKITVEVWNDLCKRRRVGYFMIGN